MPNLRSHKESQKPEESEHVSKKALAMRKYREKLKKEREHRYKEMKEKDKLRKQAARANEKELRKHSSEKTEKARKKWREQKMKYRKKLKVQTEKPHMPTVNSKCETAHASSENKRIQRFKIKVKSQKKQMAVQRTQKWRMKIKYKNENAYDNNKPDDASAMETEPSTSTRDHLPFQNRMSEHRALNKAKSALPNTPIRKARIVQKLINSPATQKQLKAKGLIMTNTTRKKLEMGNVVMKSLKDKLKTVKQKDTIQGEKRALPNTPIRKARIVQKLINSPATQKQLKAKGLIMTNTTRKKLEMGNVVMKSLKDKLKTVKQKDTIQGEKRAAYKSIVNAVLDKTVTRYHKFGSALSSFLNVRKRREGTLSDWWKIKKRATRKDRISTEVQSARADKGFLFVAFSKQSKSKQERCHHH